MPQSWNRYTYTRDNPLAAIDPDGSEVRVLGSSAFVALIDGAEKKVEKIPRVKAMIENLKASSNLHLIQESTPGTAQNESDSDTDSRNGKGTGSTTLLSIVTIGEDGDIEPIDEVLVHEFSHAEDADTGTKEDAPACSGCASKKETKAIQMENLLTGDSPRKTFGGLKVPNPKAVPADPRKKKANPRVPPI